MVRPLHRAVLKLSLLTALLFALPALSIAQKPLERNFLMKVAGLTGRDQEKIVLGSINDQDPAALVSFDIPTQRVKIRTIAELDRAALEAAFAPYGVSIISLDPIVAQQLSERLSAAASLPGFPVFVDTGDPVSDESVYQMSKAAWISAHPDLYPPAPHTAPLSPR